MDTNLCESVQVWKTIFGTFSYIHNGYESWWKCPGVTSQKLLSRKIDDDRVDSLSLLARCSPQVRRRLAARHSGSINFTYWFVFLCTRYVATALLPTQFMPIRTHQHKHQYSQHLILRIAMQYEACGAIIDRLRGNRWYLYTNVTGSVDIGLYFDENRKNTGLLTPPSTLNNTHRKGKTVHSNQLWYC